jgi:hypothetical protein
MEHPRISGQRFLNLPADHPLHFDEEFEKSNSIDKGLVWLRTVLMGENVNESAGSNQYMAKIATDLGGISEYPDMWDTKIRRKLLILFHVDRWKMTNGTYGRSLRHRDLRKPCLNIICTQCTTYILSVYVPVH